MRTKISLMLAGLTLAGSLFAATPAFAQTPSPSATPNYFQDLVAKIAQRFNLNQSDVQSVFNQAKTDKQNQREQNYENYLAQLVKDGKITDAQKQLILNKHNELKTQRQANKQALLDWAKQNNIDIQYLTGPKFGHRMGHMGMWK